MKNEAKTGVEPSVITNRNGQLSSCSGPRAVAAFRLRALMVTLRFRAATGVDMDRRFSSLKIAKSETGLRTNKIPVLLAGLEALMAREVAACEVITENTK